MSVQPPAVLSSSLQYGIVSRSLPLTGKILRGYLDASGTGLGVGNNNPNVEFTPNVSACAMSSDGGTAKIIWGFRGGEVALMTAQKAVAMDGGGRAGATAAKLVRCEAEDEHDGGVLDVVWQTAGLFVTGGADGLVKLWDAKNVRCVWTSEKKQLVDPIVRVSCDSSIILAATSSGDIIVFAGFARDAPVTELRIPFAAVAGADPSHEISALHIAPYSSAVLVGYKAHPSFYRLDISLSSASFDQIMYTNISTPISAIFPSFAEKETHKSFVITGDQLGDVTIYSWDPSPNRPHNVIHKFNAHTSPTTALAYSSNSVALVTGSEDGEIKVWDSLSFLPIRSFTFSAPRRFGVTVSEYDGINQIVVQREMLVATAGERVLAWRAGSVAKDRSHLRPMSKSVGMKGKRQKGNNKYRRAFFFSLGVSALSEIDVILEELEMKQLIAEFDPDLDRGQPFVQRAHGNEQEQINELNRLGLDEVEAVEYVLMLSRDEEEMRLRNGSGGNPRHIEEEGVFEGEDDISASSSSLDRSHVSASSSRSDSSSPPSQRSFSTFNGSSSKIQISPRSRPEPTEAGADAVTVASRTPGLDEFPPIKSLDNTSTDATTSASMSASQLSSANSNPSGSFSWGTPRRTSSSSYSAIRPRSSLLTADLARHSGMQVSKGMDDEGDVCGKLSVS
jgi:hypothetical protein